MLIANDALNGWKGGVFYHFTWANWIRSKGNRFLDKCAKAWFWKWSLIHWLVFLVCNISTAHFNPLFALSLCLFLSGIARGDFESLVCYWFELRSFKTWLNGFWSQHKFKRTTCFEDTSGATVHNRLRFQIISFTDMHEWTSTKYECVI